MRRFIAVGGVHKAPRVAAPVGAERRAALHAVGVQIVPRRTIGANVDVVGAAVRCAAVAGARAAEADIRVARKRCVAPEVGEVQRRPREVIGLVGFDVAPLGVDCQRARQAKGSVCAFKRASGCRAGGTARTVAPGIIAPIRSEGGAALEAVGFRRIPRITELAELF